MTWPATICQACLVGLDVDGAAISLLTSTASRETLWATDSTAELLEDLQFTLNEGACMEAASTGRPVLVPDIHGVESNRWPLFAAAVVEQTGVAALFALPLQWGAVNLGVLDLYRFHPGGLGGSPVPRCPGCGGHRSVDHDRAAHRPGRGRRGLVGSGVCGIGPRSIRRPGWSWSSWGSAPPMRWPGCVRMRSSSNGCSSTSPATSSPGGWCSRTNRHDRLPCPNHTHEEHHEFAPPPSPDRPGPVRAPVR